MATAPDTTTQLLRMIQTQRVVEPERLEQYLQARPITTLPSTPELAAKAFVREGLISQYQSELLLLGHPDGLSLGPYQFVDLVGRGGRSSVFKAEDTIRRRTVAVKIITLDEDEPILRKRFVREAQAVSVIDHPNVVKAFDYGDQGPILYLVMELVYGTDLHRLVKSAGPLPTELACHYMRQAASGVHAVHAAGLVHRDVKPGNFLATNGGDVKLCDLGIARYVSGKGEPLTEMSASGSFLGTPQFLAPEQLANSHTADHRADIYGLGATLYFLLTGKAARRALLAGGNYSTPILTKTVPLRERRPDLPPELLNYICLMLSDEPSRRPKSAGDVAAVLSQWTGSGNFAHTLPALPSHSLIGDASSPTHVIGTLPKSPTRNVILLPALESTPTLVSEPRSPAIAIPIPPPVVSHPYRTWLLTALFFVVGFCGIRWMTAPSEVRADDRTQLAERVRARVNTDKVLAGMAITVVPLDDRSVCLRGSVSNVSERERVIDLARTTTGVDDVKDEMAVVAK